ncbi:DsbA family protein [Stutzerimonas urumqiensis]|uniref:DsbA family oxidoreductase n=1 Tax=Stutzerimonas urumqiensis TaxID=638269 RepID=UPI003DA5E9D0
MNSPATVSIDVWSDYVCPFCYLELPLIRQLQRDYGTRLAVSWRAFELRPEPLPTLEPEGDYLRDTWARAVYPMAELRRMALRLPAVQPRSRMAFELARFAADNGRFDAVHEALFRAFFEEGLDIGDEAVLLELAEREGLDTEALRHAIETGRYLEAIFADRQEAEHWGIRGVPALLVRGQRNPEQAQVIAGAVDFPRLQAAVEQVLARQ